MEQVFIDKMEKFIKETTDALKLNKDNSDRLIEKTATDLRSELKAYYDEVKKLNVSVPGLAAEEEARKKNGKSFSFAKAIMAIAQQHRKDFNSWDNAPYEMEVFQEAQKRATVSGLTGGQGGYLVPVDVAKEILKPSMAAIVMKDLGITVYEDLVGDLPFPNVTSRPTLSWVKEASAAAAQGVTMGEKWLRPKTGSMLLKLSNRLIKQTSGTAEQISREMMQEGIALGLDDMMINGTGSASEPLGILQDSAIPASAVIGASGGRLTVDKVASMTSDVEEANYLKTPGTGGMLCHPRVKSGLKRERVAQYSGDKFGLPLINPMLNDKALEDLTGLRIRSTTAVPKNIVKTSTTLSAAVLGEWKQFCLGMWGGLALRASDVAGSAFEKNELWVVAFVDCDTLNKQPTAFTKVSDAETLESNW